MKDGALICTKAPLLSVCVHGFFGISVMMPFTYGEDFRERGC